MKCEDNCCREEATHLWDEPGADHGAALMGCVFSRTDEATKFH